METRVSVAHLHTSRGLQSAKVFPMRKGSIDAKGSRQEVQSRVNMLIALLVQKGLKPRVGTGVLLDGGSSPHVF